jgi:hypothetical protein
MDSKKDFFDEPAAMVEQDQSKAHHLIVEARAELNRAERSNEETVAVYRAVGEKFVQIKELLGRGNWKAWIAKRAKMSERQVERIIQLAESPDTLPIEEQMAILWGNPAKAGGAGSGSSAVKGPTDESHKKLWKHVNGVRNLSKGLAEHLKKPDDFEFIDKHLKSIETRIKALEKEAGV